MRAIRGAKADWLRATGGNLIEFLRSLLVVFTVVALSFATGSAASALPCTGDQQATEMALATSHFDCAKEQAYRHAMDSKCSRLSCCAVGGMAYLASADTLVALTIRTSISAAPEDQSPAGITIAPVTGPPRLLA